MGWLIFLDAEAVKALKGVTHRLFDHERELYEDSRVTWLRAEKLAGYCYVLNVDKKEFYERKRSHLLPNHPRDYVYFGSRIFDFETKEVWSRGARSPQNSRDGIRRKARRTPTRSSRG